MQLTKKGNIPCHKDILSWNDMNGKAYLDFGARQEGKAWMKRKV